MPWISKTEHFVSISSVNLKEYVWVIWGGFEMFDWKLLRNDILYSFNLSREFNVGVCNSNPDKFLPLRQSFFTSFNLSSIF